MLQMKMIVMIGRWRVSIIIWTVDTALSRVTMRTLETCFRAVCDASCRQF